MGNRDFYFRVSYFDILNQFREYDFRIGINSLNFVTDFKNAWFECFAQLYKEYFDKDILLKKVEFILLDFDGGENGKK